MIDTNSKLKVRTPSDREIVLTREFDAPRALVFKAITDPAAIPQWWGPRRFTTVVDEMDVRPGGKWRYVQHDAEGNEFAFHGTYQEVVPPERLSYTFEWEGLPGHISLETITLEERNGKTTSVDVVRFDSKEDRDGMLQSGMTSGASESMDRLEEYLRTQR